MCPVGYGMNQGQGQDRVHSFLPRAEGSSSSCKSREINHICSVIPASKFDAYTNYVHNDVKCNGVWLNLET